MASLNDAQRDAAINVGFELAKLGIQHFVGRKLAKEEEDELLDMLREQEAKRTFKTPSELIGDIGDVSNVGGTTGEEE